MSGPATVAVDLPCLRCRYNLRTLPRDAVCPECGTAVVESEWAAQVLKAPLGRLRVRGDAWLRAMRGSVNAALLAWVLGALIGSVVINLIRPPNLDAVPQGVAWLAFFSTPYVVSCLAPWRLAAIYRGWARLCARLLALGYVAWLAMLFLNWRFARFYFPRGPMVWRMRPESIWALLPQIGLCCIVITPIAAAFTFVPIVRALWVARYHVRAVLAGMYGTALTGFLCWISAAAITEGSHSDFPSGELLAVFAGPTGLHAAVGLALKELGDILDHNWTPGPNGEGLLVVAVLGGILLATILMGYTFAVLQRTLTRAIKLGPVAALPPDVAPQQPAAVVR